MNYRHHFHAGNFADLVKHAALLTALKRLGRGHEPLVVIDTHAGAGLYDLAGDMAVKSGEAAAGVGRLMADSAAPAALAALEAAVGQANPAGGLRFYPGSPLLAARALRSGDRLVAYELRAEDAETLRAALNGVRCAVEVSCADGFESAVRRVPSHGPVLVLIDPPFERADDYARIQVCVSAVLARNPAAVVMVWTPLKDLETFDRLLRGIEEGGAPATLVVETRLRPLDDPMRMNGCALIIANPPPGLEVDLRPVCEWVVAALGGKGGEARIWSL